MVHRRAFLLTPFAVLTNVLAADRKPNIVLIVARGWRGVSTPWANDPNLHAPNLAKFAEGAMVFTRAYSASPSPGPGRAAIATGRFPHVNGATRDGVGPRTEEVTIGAALQTGGYNVAEGIDAMKKASEPFFANISLDPQRFTKTAGVAGLQLRANVPAEFKNAREDLAAYYGMLADLDDQLGKMLAATPHDAIVVFTSDSGAQIGSHGIAGNDMPFEESVRVPLAIGSPRGGTGGSASDALVSAVDLLPTLLTMSGAPGYDGIQGFNLSPLLMGMAGGDRQQWVFAEGKIGTPDEWRMLVEGMDKITVDSRGEVLGLYNLAADPYEITNRAQDPTQQLKLDQLSATMRAVRSQLLDFRRR